MKPFHKDPAFYTWSIIAIWLMATFLLVRPAHKAQTISSVWQVVSR